MVDGIFDDLGTGARNELFCFTTTEIAEVSMGLYRPLPAKKVQRFGEGRAWEKAPGAKLIR